MLCEGETLVRVSKELSHQGAARFGLDLDTLRFLGGEDGDVYEGADVEGAFRRRQH